MIRDAGPDRAARSTEDHRSGPPSPPPRVVDRKILFRIALVALILIFIGLQYRLWIGEGSYAERHRIAMQRDALAQANAKARARNEAMQAEVDDLKADDGAAESRAREEMGMVKSGETFFLTVPDIGKSSGRKTPGPDEQDGS